MKVDSKMLDSIRVSVLDIIVKKPQMEGFLRLLLSNIKLFLRVQS